jgi:adenine-specific DNA-methyltransferase
VSLQLELIENETRGKVFEDEEYLSQQLITYIGNKRSLLDFIGTGLARVQKRLGKSKLDLFDVFSGSGVVSRYFKQFSRRLVVNDIEKYARVINECYLANRSELDFPALRHFHGSIAEKLRSLPLIEGFIFQMYAPKDDDNISPEERVFYTGRNARFLDSARQCIEKLPEAYRKFFLGPLLSEASIHANTSGVFKGFYKNSETGVGQFGGKNQDALLRILGDIQLQFPLFSNFECDVEICMGDSNEVVTGVEEVDVAYLDPPYNQHPYGSNYFMLNLLAEYELPRAISEVSGIPVDWKRSFYNRPRQAYEALSRLVADIKARYLLVSFNSEGFISKDEMQGMLGKMGKLETLETRYNAFKGSRNLGGRNIHVKEYLYLLEKQ